MKGMNLHTLSLHLRQNGSRLSSSPTRPQARIPAITTAAPKLRQRARTVLPVSWHGSHRAFYYFDASHQTAMSLRILLAECQSGADHLGLLPPQQLLAESIDTFLRSICPGIKDDWKNHEHFLSLLHLHLSQLNSAELKTLTGILKAQSYECCVVESIVDDEFLREYGFANGPPRTRMHTLLQTKGFFNLLDDLQQEACPLSRLEPALALASRAWLAGCAASWQHSNRSLLGLLESAQALTEILDVPYVFQSVIVAAPASGASMLEVQNHNLLIDTMVAALLEHDGSGKLFASVLRDLLEIVLTKKLFGADATPQHLTKPQRCRLLDSMDMIFVHSDPPANKAALQAQAEAVLTNPTLFGHVNIMPTLGAALGHAWIAPALSLVPDKSRPATESGTRFVHTGFQLTARESPIREWPVHFLSSQENDVVYPEKRAWKVTVPVDAESLQAAAEGVVREWRERGLPYRFIGARPGVDPTGCRVTVWQAVQRGMSAEALALFHHYNRGLPEPDSPTEVWLRLNGMMRWMEKLCH